MSPTVCCTSPPMSRPLSPGASWLSMAGRRLNKATEVLCSTRPTVCLDVIALVARSCEYDRGQIAHCAAQEFVVHVATQRGLTKRRQHRHPPRAQPVAPMRERHCRRPRLTPRSGTAQAPSRDQGQPGGAHGRRNDPMALQFHGMRCPPASPLFASWPWLLHTGCSLETIDMTVC